MHLVNDIHALFNAGGRIDRLVPQGTDIFNAVIGGGVNFNHIHNRAVFDSEAAGAFIAWIPVFRLLAVERPGKNLCAGGFTRSSDTDHKVGVAGAVILNLVFEGFGNLLLTDNIVKGARAPFSV